MYPIKNLFTHKTIGQFGFENGQYKIDGEFPAKEEIKNLAEHAVQIKGERFNDGIREENVPLDPKTQLDLIANFVNGNLSDHSIRVINYEEEVEDEDIDDMEDMVNVQSHTREGGKVHVDEYERHEPGTGEKEQTTEEFLKENEELIEKTKSMKSIKEEKGDILDKIEANEKEMKSIYNEIHQLQKQLTAENIDTDILKQQTKLHNKRKRLEKENKELEKQLKGLMGFKIITDDTDKEQTTDKILYYRCKECDKQFKQVKGTPTCPSCQSTNIVPVKKKVPAEETEEKPPKREYSAREWKEGSFDQAFSLLKDNIEVGKGIVFADGTCVFHSRESTELYGSIEKLQSIHAGNIQLTKEDGKPNLFTDCPRRKSLLEDVTMVGYVSPSGYLDHTVDITKVTAGMKGITIADVILAREMIQDYHVSELPPWLRDQLPPDKEFIRVLKSYEELEQTFKDMKELPATQFHVEDSFPSMDSPVVLSVVKNIRADPKCRCIRGKIYFVDKNWPEAVMDSVHKGEITAVSIGGSTEFGPGGNFNGQFYDLKQVHIKGGHLAILPGAEGRCPKGLCGVNLKDSKNSLVGIENESKEGHVKGHFNMLNLTSPSFSQPIFQIADSLKSVIDIKESHQIEGNTFLNAEDVDNMAENDKNLAKFQDALAAKNQQIAELQKELMSFKDSASAKKVKELEDSYSAAKDQFAALQKENAKLKDDAAKLETRVKDADTFRHSMYDRALLNTPFYKGKEKDLAAMPLDEKAIVFRTAQNLGAIQLADAAILSDGFPKPTDEQRQQFMDSGGKSRPKMPDATFDVPKEGAK